MGNTLNDILAELEKVAQPIVEEGEVADAPVENQVDEDVELRKIAEEYDAAGRIIARGFADELHKIAVGVTGMTPNTAATPDNPAVQLSNEDVNLGEVAQVVGAIRQQTQGAEAKMSPAGQVTVTPQVVTPAGPAEVPPVAADMKGAAEDAVAEKKAEVVQRLWQHYFGGN